MSDKERLIALLESFGIMPYVEPGKVSVVAQQSDNVEGYYDFEVIFSFNADGDFMKMGIWE